MSKRTVFTTITPLPAGVTRDTVLETLHNHVEMIDLNPLVIERHVCPPPRDATAEEFHCTWYSLTDRVSYLPGVSGKVQYNACFHDLAVGVQTHVYAPLGLDIKEKWSLGGSLPGEPAQPVELGLGVPKQGLYLREDCDMRCNIMMTKFVRGTLTKAHKVLVDRLVEKAGLEQVKLDNQRISMASATSSSPTSVYSDDASSSGFPSPGLYSDATSIHSVMSSGHAPLPPRSPQPPQYTELPKYAELPAQRQATPQQSAPRHPDEKRKTEPFPDFVDPESVPEPLKPRRQERHSYMAYQPVGAPSASAQYSAYRPPAPQHGYSAYRPVNVHHLSAQQPAHGRSQSAGSVPHIPNTPVELEG
ncbi:hypothetical protein GTA08_BOTSDO08091 [Neofusicoccum parvum]|uniref:Uncharacterized protein n=1 Tax=Neofusicoccum parvum TaxID=310453 RepID=A0ACB5S8H4_9PEZI|nr:hypothetical protein GTA08_BOTSDO08091 [Neofusicoccum parvum]